MDEAELIVLRESLQDQVNCVNSLRAELEEERKAAASGVEEALSMIMRLQQEKAAAKMEACQYKRMAEEKLHHAEESMAALNEVIFQKELEIAFLRYQVQNYKQKILIIGAKDFGFEPVKSNAYTGLKKGSTLPRNIKLNRNVSLPAISLQELLSEVDAADKYCSLLPSENVECPKHITENCNTDKFHNENHAMSIMEKYDINEVQNWREFRPEPVYTDRRMDQSLDPKTCNEDDSTSTYEDISRTETMSLEEELTFLPNTKEEDATCLSSQARHQGERGKFSYLPNRSMQTRSDIDAINSVTIQDVYEIQDSQNVDGLCGTYNEMRRYLSSGAKNTNRESDLLQNEDLSFESYIYANYENKSPEQHEDVILTTQECRNITVPCTTDIEELKDRLHLLEDSVRSIKQEDQEREKKQSELLKRVVEQLDMIKTHFRKPIFDCNQDDDCLLHLAEAMSCFWI